VALKQIIYTYLRDAFRRRTVRSPCSRAAKGIAWFGFGYHLLMCMFMYTYIWKAEWFLERTLPTGRDRGCAEMMALSSARSQTHST
jgi:hypothetical protein